MNRLLKDTLFPKISHINTTNQPFPVSILCSSSHVGCVF